MSKRITSLLLAACLLFCLAACGNSSEQTDTPDDPIGDIASTISPATATPEASEEPVETEEPVSTPSPVPSSPASSPAVTVTPSPEPTPESTPEATPPSEPSAETPAAETPEASETPGEGGEESPIPSEQPASGSAVDLQAFYDTISATYEFSSMMDMDAEMMDAYYPGLSAVSCSQFVGKIAMITASANEIVLIECASADDVETVQTILETRRQSQIDGGAWYPESIAMWENSQICVNGNFLMLVSHSSAADIAASFNALFTE